jgi:hypothetical protein
MNTLFSLTRTPNILAIGVLTLGISATAHASSIVQTYGVNVHAAGANTNVGNGVSATYNRDWLGYAFGGAVTNTLLGGNTSTTTCNVNWPCASSLNVTSNQTATGNATAAAAESSFTVSLVPNPTVYLAKSIAKADLGAGTVGVYAQGQRTPTNTSGIEAQIGYAGARIADTLTFNIAGANAGTVTPIAVRYVVDGLIVPGVGQTGANNTLNFWFGFGNALAFGTVQQDSTNPAFVNGTQNSSWASATYTQLTEELIQFDGVFNVTGSSASLGVSLEMLATATGGAVDYGSTGRFSFVNLPSNVTFTSGSGVFLTSNSSSGGSSSGSTTVSEPASLALLGLGLMGLARARRRPA